MASPSNQPISPSPLYRFGCGLLTIIFRVVFRTWLHGTDHVPPNGPLLVVSNHISLADPPFLGWALPRAAQFMAAAELFDKPVLRWILPRVSCFPVDRGRVDARPVREAIRRLRAGACVIIFPEGGIRLGAQSVLGGSPQLRPGATAIAELGRCPILPVIVRGTRAVHDWRNWFRRPVMSAEFGGAFCLYRGPDQTNRDRRQAAEDLVRTVLLDLARAGERQETAGA